MMVGSDHGMEVEWARWRAARYGLTLALIILVFVGFHSCSALARDLLVPDLAITPGVVRTDITQETVCTTKWGKDKRYVTAAMKRQVFALYRLSGNDDKSCKLDRHGRRFEIDHLCSRELGCADDIKNLWPQCYSGRWNAVMKDRLENRLHKEVCAGNISLERAQREIILDWRIPYRRYFGEPTGAK